MKKLLLLVFLSALLIGQSSCVSMKKDCQGVRHTRLKNGVYL